MSHMTNTDERPREKTTTYSAVAVDCDAQSNEDGFNLPAYSVPQGWPKTPQPLRKSSLVLCGELALLILPIGFIGSPIVPSLMWNRG